MEGEEVDREVSPPILKREREEEQPDSLLWVTGELGSPTFKPPSDTRSPEGGGGGGEMDLVEGNKPVEVPDPEDSSTTEESVVTFSGQRRNKPLVGDLVSYPESVGSNMGKREDTVLGMDIYRLERNGASENAGSNPDNVSTGEGMAATFSGTGHTKPLDSVRSSVGELEDKVPCRDTYPFDGNWVRENTGSRVEDTLIWTENQTPFMVDRNPSLENEKMYDRDARDTIPLSDLHQLGKALGSRVADVGNGAHHEVSCWGLWHPCWEHRPGPLRSVKGPGPYGGGDSGGHQEGGPWEKEIDSQWGESHVHGGSRPWTSDGRPCPVPKWDVEKWVYGRRERGGCGKRETGSVKRGFLRGMEINKG